MRAWEHPGRPNAAMVVAAVLHSCQMVSTHREKGSPVRVHVGPFVDDVVLAAIRRAGGVEVDEVAQAEAVVWLNSSPDTFDPELLHEGVRWVQLAFAGVESWISRGLIDAERLWTSAAGVYGPQVAEHALALLLAGARNLHRYARARTWDAHDDRALRGSRVLIVGAGGIGRELIRLLTPLRVEVVAVTRSGRDVPGAFDSLPVARLHEAWGASRFVVLAAPATPGTRHLVGQEELTAMRPDAWLVNVARGSLVDTEALVRALRENRIGGAALDVTEPEPLPDGHPLWSEPRALITPHHANPWEDLRTALAERVGTNLTRLREGREPLGVIDLERGY